MSFFNINAENFKMFLWSYSIYSVNNGHSFTNCLLKNHLVHTYVVILIYYPQMPRNAASFALIYS